MKYDYQRELLQSLMYEELGSPEAAKFHAENAKRIWQESEVQPTTEHVVQAQPSEEQLIRQIFARGRSVGN